MGVLLVLSVVAGIDDQNAAHWLRCSVIGRKPPSESAEAGRGADYCFERA